MFVQYHNWGNIYIKCGIIVKIVRGLRHFMCIYTLFVCSTFDLPFFQCSQNLTIGIIHS